MRDRHEWIDPEDNVRHVVSLDEDWLRAHAGCPVDELRVLVRETLRLAGELERTCTEAQRYTQIAEKLAADRGRVQGEVNHRLSLRPLLERCAQSLRLVAGNATGRDLDTCPPDRMPSGTEYLAELYADLRREMGKGPR